MTDRVDPVSLTELNEAYPDTLAARMGIRMTEASPERVVGTMPVEGNTQPYGVLHGGASCVLAETLGSTGAALAAGAEKVTVGIETQLHAGRTLAAYEIVITDDDGRRVCTARLSCLYRDAVPGMGRPGAHQDG